MQNVVITGASSGIGAATALALDARGARVFAGVERRLLEVNVLGQVAVTQVALPLLRRGAGDLMRKARTRRAF